MLVFRVRWITILTPTFAAGCFSLLVAATLPSVGRADERPAPWKAFLQAHCFSCHDTATKKGGLDLETLTADLAKVENFRTWVKVHDKVRSGEMPPAKRKRPPQAETDAVLRELDEALTAADHARRKEGRAVFRRLNRTEYENSLRDLLALPGLSVRDRLPEDGRAHGFDKTGTALDLSFVQLNKYLEAADAALDVVIAPIAESPVPFRKRLYPAFEWRFGNLLVSDGDAIPLKGLQYDHDAWPVIRDEATMRTARARLETIGASYQGGVACSVTRTRTTPWPSTGSLKLTIPAGID